MLNAYTAVIFYNYYFNIPDCTLGSLSAVLVPSPKLFYATIFKREASLVAGLGGGSQYTEAAAAAWLCTSVLPQHLSLTRANLPPASQLLSLPPVRLNSHCCCGGTWLDSIASCERRCLEPCHFLK